ncbi:hypothetical protein PTKIN_Ptkin11bG0126800 [Pterospermum kingtungense]
MDHENSIVEEKPNSLFEVDQSFMKKILARNSFVGESTRMFHTQNVASVPFVWEIQPGTPKHPQIDHIMPPITPPPAMQSQILEKPSVTSTTAPTTMSCLFWKKSWRSHYQGKKNISKGKGRGGGYFHGNNATYGKEINIAENVESSDGTMSSSDRSTSSSLSSVSPSSSSSSNRTSNSSSSSRLCNFAKGLIRRSP